MRKYLADEIGDEYKNWKNGNIVLINAPTGSGKTTFIIEKFLARELNQGRKILYLVNRKILREQLEMEIEINANKILIAANSLQKTISDMIWISTYQEIEQWILRGEENYLNQFDTVVYDEAHYFYADSNFNTHTQLSFDCLLTYFNLKLQIFMSATIDNVQLFIKGREDFDKDASKYLLIKNRYREYRLSKDYSFVDWKFFNTQEEMKKIIFSNDSKKQKWLIFVDSKEVGKQLYKEFENGNNSVAYIDAEYEKDEAGNECVQSIAKHKQFNENILIATAVMDNGISIIDEKLRNIVIMADVEETFLQMLGRKREDNEKITLYFFRRNVEYFQRRLNAAQSILKLYDKYLNCLTHTNVYLGNICEKMQSNYGGWQQLLYFHSNIFPDCHFQQTVLNDVLLGSPRKRAEAVKLLYSYRGLLAVNYFSLYKYRKLSDMYSKLISELENDEDAFIKMQASWLGASEEEIDAKIINAKNELNQLHAKSIEQHFSSQFEEKNIIKLQSNENIEMKETLKKHFLYFAEIGKVEQKDIESLGKNDRPIQPALFNRLMNEAGLPYNMSKNGGALFVIQKIEK